MNVHSTDELRRVETTRRVWVCSVIVFTNTPQLLTDSNSRPLCIRVPIPFTTFRKCARDSGVVPIIKNRIIQNASLRTVLGRSGEFGVHRALSIHPAVWRESCRLGGKGRNKGLRRHWLQRRVLGIFSSHLHKRADNGQTSRALASKAFTIYPTKYWERFSLSVLRKEQSRRSLKHLSYSNTSAEGGGTSRRVPPCYGQTSLFQE